ncbi:hypothetical protein E2C01_060989 [Portunus trituberculatus]|uniref:Uncharacterized protein n=1 Tax=Portunus trituberculatus TaxID=210409 RepID=A0A5B7HDV2_PORTR|nr:hypothetical protein [Portunus trituberculatus]
MPLQNVFFYLYWENDTTAAYDRLTQEGISPMEGPAEPYLLTAFKTRRLAKPHKSGVRSKYIVRPERVMELGNHNVWEYIGLEKLMWEIEIVKTVAINLLTTIDPS